MIRIREVIVCEGRYDKNALKQVVDATVVTTQCDDGDPKDHVCNICGGPVGDEHKAAEGKHTCDYCGQIVDQCTDADPKDHKCDRCGAAMGGEHKPAEGKHTCGYCNEVMTECADDNNDVLCDLCGKDLFTASVSDGKIVLENIPVGLKIIVAGYEDGQMKAVQMTEAVDYVIRINSDLLECSEIVVFFLNGTIAPRCEFLLVE